MARLQRQRDVGPSPSLSGIHHSLSMPLIDLLDVPKHNPVTASKILRDPLSSHGGHVTLQEGWGESMAALVGKTPSPKKSSM